MNTQRLMPSTNSPSWAHPLWQGIEEQWARPPTVCTEMFIINLPVCSVTGRIDHSSCPLLHNQDLLQCGQEVCHPQFEGPGGWGAFCGYSNAISASYYLGVRVGHSGAPRLSAYTAPGPGN